MNRLTNYCGKWVRYCGWYPDTKLRLWDSTKGKWGGINPHDKFEMIKGSSIIHLKGDILHYSYYTLTDHINQVNKFTDISANALFNMGKRASLLKIKLSPLFFETWIFRWLHRLCNMPYFCTCSIFKICKTKAAKRKKGIIKHL